MIIDAHLHLDPTVDGTAAGAAAELNKQLKDAGIARAVVLQLEQQRWSKEEVASAIKPYPTLKAFVNIHPHTEGAENELAIGINELGYIGLKLHPRLQEFSLDDIRTVMLVEAAGKMNIPVLIDAFPDGTHLMQGFSPLKYAELAKNCLGTKIIWAHMGGHYVLDFMMLAKRLPNVYMDMSYSLLYYQGSAVPVNMVYAMKSMRFDRVFYGSDYPDRPVKESLERSQFFLQEQGVSNQDIDKLMGQNAKHFFNWKDL